MALSLKDKETHSLARQVAKLTGESLTEAVRGALRLRDEQLKRGKQPWDDAAIDAIVARFKALPVLDDRSDDEILGYGENGLSSARRSGWRVSARWAAGANRAWSRCRP
ncbi:MAG: type II toxin-antitoxin system VapB family antitoxin [Gluconacetobacter diazotrophicus]|nr:type II toxin-antitoxin system VapB family antitoxin [Gluconacetobacter diazotrophicus]